MISITRINKDNESTFLSVIDNYSLAVSDILLGAVETGAGAVTCCHYEAIDEFDDVRALFAALECKGSCKDEHRGKI